MDTQVLESAKYKEEAQVEGRWFLIMELWTPKIIDNLRWIYCESYLKVHKTENFFDSDFGICVISLLVIAKY